MSRSVEVVTSTRTYWQRGRFLSHAAALLRAGSACHERRRRRVSASHTTRSSHRAGCDSAAAHADAQGRSRALPACHRPIHFPSTRRWLQAVTPQLAGIMMSPASRQLPWTAWAHGHPRRAVVELVANAVSKLCEKVIMERPSPRVDIERHSRGVFRAHESGAFTPCRDSAPRADHITGRG